MTEILLIRHGETPWNAVRRVQGHIDVPLNAEGERQAEALGRALLAEPLDAVFASDLQRARQTAEAIAKPRGMTVQIESGLRERCFGGFEGLLYSEIGSRFPQAHAAWRARELDAPLPGGERSGEAMRVFFERAIGAITRILERAAYRRIAVVTHGGVLECAYRAAQGLLPDRPRDFEILNASINRLRWDGSRLHLVQWGDVAHLKNGHAGEQVVALDEIDR